MSPQDFSIVTNSTPQFTNETPLIEPAFGEQLLGAPLSGKSSRGNSSRGAPSRAKRIRSALISVTMYGLALAAAVLCIGALSGTLSKTGEAGAPSTDTVAAHASLGDAAISERAEQALELVTFDWETTFGGWSIEFVQGDSEIAGYTWSAEQRIEIFVRESSTPESLYRVLAHEFGHAADVSLNDGDRRRTWLAQREARDAPWWPANGKADFQTGAGDFAEVFVVWMTGDESDFRSEIAPLPSAEDLAIIDELLGVTPADA